MAFPASNGYVFSHPAQETPPQAASVPSVALESMGRFCPLSLVSLSHGVGFSSHWCFLVVGSQLYSRFLLGLPVIAVAPLPWVAARKGGRRGHVSLKVSPLFQGICFSSPNVPPHQPMEALSNQSQQWLPSLFSVHTSLPPGLGCHF